MRAGTYAAVLSAFTIAAASAIGATVPGKEWERIQNPQTVGFSAAKLAALRQWLKAGNTTSMQVIVGGKSLFEYGDLSLVSKVASVRKSIIAMLIAKHMDKINGSRTVKQIGLDDTEPFLPSEEQATLYDLLTARSGVYLRSHNEEDPGENLIPRRGSYPPAAHFFYHNWDFNAAGTAFEKMTGLDVYDALETDLAVPLGMQDFDRKRQKRVSERPATVHPEFAMFLSTRDMARLGLLMLHSGKSGDKQVIEEGPAQTIVKLVTPFRDMNPESLRSAGKTGRWGYGLMWWVWDAPSYRWVSGPFQGAFAAKGVKGQYITVLPMLDMVVVHKVDITDDHAPEVTEHDFQTMLEMVIAANCGKDGKSCW